FTIKPKEKIGIVGRTGSEHWGTQPSTKEEQHPQLCYPERSTGNILGSPRWGWPSSVWWSYLEAASRLME
ncbi:ABCC5 isoform 4, partial [Pan troglodytes]